MVLKGYSSKDAVKYTGVSYRQLDYWNRIGFITPSIQPASGRGTERIFSFKDLVKLKVAKQLRGAGANLKKIQSSIHYLNQNISHVEDPLSELMFITDGESIFVLTEDPDIIINTLKEGQLCWNLNIGNIGREIVEYMKPDLPEKKATI